MNIFILEDSLSRQIKFRNLFEKENHLVICDRVEEAKRALSDESFDVIFLDHDLGDYSIKETGYELAKWIENKNLHFAQIFIHSCNLPGAMLMEEALRNASDNIVRKSFPYLIHDLERA